MTCSDCGATMFEESQEYETRFGVVEETHYCCEQCGHECYSDKVISDQQKGVSMAEIQWSRKEEEE